MNLPGLDVVRQLHGEIAQKKSGPELRQALRTELHERLQGLNALPGEEAVTDADRVAADKEKATGGHPQAVAQNGLHFVQRKHQSALWRETDRLINEAGV